MDDLCARRQIPTWAERDFMMFLLRLCAEEDNSTFRVFVSNGKTEDLSIKVLGFLYVSAVKPNMAKLFDS